MYTFETNEQNRKFQKRNGDINNNQIQILELKNTITKLENSQ